MERPVYLDQIKNRLLNHEFQTLMGFLRATKKLVDQIRFFKVRRCRSHRKKESDGILVTCRAPNDR